MLAYTSLLSCHPGLLKLSTEGLGPKETIKLCWDQAFMAVKAQCT